MDEVTRLHFIIFAENDDVESSNTNKHNYYYLNYDGQLVEQSHFSEIKFSSDKTDKLTTTPSRAYPKMNCFSIQIILT